MSRYFGASEYFVSMPGKNGTMILDYSGHQEKMDQRVEQVNRGSEHRHLAVSTELRGGTTDITLYREIKLLPRPPTEITRRLNLYNAIMLPYIDKSGETYIYIPTIFPFREYIIGGDVDYAEFMRKYNKWLSILAISVPVLGAIEGAWLSYTDSGAIISINYMVSLLVPQMVILLFVLGEMQTIGLKKKIDRDPKIRRIVRIITNASDFTKTNLVMNSKKKYDSFMLLKYSSYEPYVFLIYPIIIFYCVFLNLSDGPLSKVMISMNFITLFYGCTMIGKIGLALYRLRRGPSVE